MKITQIGSSKACKKKTIHLLDTITDLLKAFGSKADSINSKFFELKELLISILKIAQNAKLVDFYTIVQIQQIMTLLKIAPFVDQDIIL